MTKIQFQDFQHLEIKAAFWLLSQIHYISVLWGFANLPQTCNYCNFYALKKPNICILVFVNCKELYIYICLLSLQTYQCLKIGAHLTYMLLSIKCSPISDT